MKGMIRTDLQSESDKLHGFDLHDISSSDKQKSKWAEEISTIFWLFLPTALGNHEGWWKLFRSRSHSGLL